MRYWLPFPRRTKAGRGQVLVELILVLPVFAFLMFLLMEICNICFQAVFATHVAFECAHGAALAEGPSNHGSGGGGGQSKANDVLAQLLPSTSASVTVSKESTGSDPQTGQPTADLKVTLRWPVNFLFPGLKTILKTGGLDVLKITVPMSVEYPAYG